MRQTALLLVRRALRAALAATLLVVAACATTREVEGIVQASNRLLLDATALETDADPSAGDAAAEAVAQRIDAFVAAHPGEPATTAPLRVRQAMIYAVRGKETLAGAAFRAIARREDLSTERDLALYDLREVIPWWYRWAPVGDVDAAWKDTAKRALVTFDGVADPLAAESGTRFLVEEMRAWTAWKLANATAVPQTQQEALEAGVERFAKVFDAADQALLTGRDGTRPGGLDQRLSRVLRGRTVLDAFRATSGALGNGVQRNWRPAWVSQWFARPN